MQESFVPTPDQPPSPDTGAVRRSNKRKLIWGLICLIAPTLLLIVLLPIYAISNFVLSPGPAAQYDGPGVDCMNDPQAGACAPENERDAELFGEQPTGRAIGNTILFALGSITMIAWLPGIIVGIVLLSTRKSIVTLT